MLYCLDTLHCPRHEAMIAHDIRQCAGALMLTGAAALTSFDAAARGPLSLARALSAFGPRLSS
jgi:hypothetical protein